MMETETASFSGERRLVPWGGFEVFLLFSLWFVLPRIVIGLLLAVFTEPTVTESTVSAVTTSTASTTEHPLSQLLEQGKKSPLILGIVFFCGVITAPLTEEFLFRLLFQGWLSKFFSNNSQEVTEHKFRFPLLSGIFPIVIVSLIFALLHGGTRPVLSAEVQFYSLLGICIVHLFVFCFGITFLCFSYGRSVLGFGFKAERIVSDLFVAAGTFILSAPFIFGVHLLFRNYFPNSVTDPVPLFIFSILLGILFFRTNRLFPCFLLHALLNGFSFMLAFFQ